MFRLQFNYRTSLTGKASINPPLRTCAGANIRLMSIMHRFSTSQPLSNVCTAIIISRGCSMLRGDLSPFEHTSCLAVLETRMSKTEDTKLKLRHIISRVQGRKQEQAPNESFAVRGSALLVLN